jgi:hypothetical protein
LISVRKENLDEMYQRYDYVSIREML